MGKMLDVYFDADKHISKINSNNKPIFYVSDRKHFSKFTKKHVSFKNDYPLLTEWDLTENLDSHYNQNELATIEAKYFKNSSIWEPLIADRRVFMGKFCKYTQDYAPNYTNTEMMSLLINSVKLIENFFDLHKPQIIIGFTIATFGEYLIALIAKKQGIKFIQLRHTKIKNYYTFSEDLHEEFNRIRKDFSKEVKNIENEGFISNYISQAKNNNMIYEGTVGYGDSILKVLLEYPKYFLYAIYCDLRDFRLKKDNHYMVSMTSIFFYDKFYRFFRAKYQNLVLSNSYFPSTSLNNERYIFYPLHAEPEIAISIFSRFYQNQIEVIRNIAMSLPAGYKLIVKEHPRNIGRRKVSYYRKILQIPNAEIVDPKSSTNYLISNSRLLVVLTGFLGFEAIMSKVPVITLGSAMYNMLPKSIANHVENIKNLRSEIMFSLRNFNYDQVVIEKYLHSVIVNSERVDLYTVLLQKIGRDGGSNYSEDLYLKNIIKLSNLIENELHEK